MKYHFLEITGDQIKAGLGAYWNWEEKGESDTIANLVCEVHLAMNQACTEKTVVRVDQSSSKFPELLAQSPQRQQGPM